MKKIFMYLLVLMLGMLLICSCGNTDTDTETSTDSDTATNAETDTETDTAEEAVDNSSDTQEGESDTETTTNTNTDADSETNSEQNNNDSTHSNLSVAEKRDLKVNFNIDVHHMGMLPEKDDNSTVLDRHLIAIMGENEDGNECIEYSPNAYSFYVLITCQNTLNDAWNIIDGQINKHFAHGLIEVDAVTLGENMIIVYFPDFGSYSLCQDDMLNRLSEKDSVSNIEIGFFDIQNGTTKPKSTYEYIDVGNAFEEHRYIKSYEEFVSLLGNKIESDERLQGITSQTFEENYVFVVVNWHYRNFDISDAKLVNNTVFFTTNRYGQNGALQDLLLYNNACITFVPKAELGELPQNVTVRGLEIFLLTDEWYDKTE